MWNIERFRTASNQQEFQVCIKVGDFQDLNVDSESLVNLFKEDLQNIKRPNCFAACYGYKAEIIDSKTVEIWKMKANSDKNYLMFRLTKGPDTPDPFAHLFKI